ncbi:MFS transporter [Streptomyces caniscabiei]|uniref:MFS transporter n=1 Tax=Streptomyces caniscabiei TaxID=2746961 RepID=UPI0029A42FF2|nr:MFS transporter [Streptomyces caniscabiei]MDX2775786.1 MFS transporter [Streptomyces caniscabiei]
MIFKNHAAATRLDRVARLYLAYKFLSALYFTYPIFYEFSTQIVSPLQIGIFFSVIGACGVLAEVPTGILADKHGRKSSGLIGVALLAAAPLVILFGHTFTAYLAAALLYGFGRAFLSGALESLVYDHKNVSKEVYRKVNTLEITFGQAGILVSAACGGVLFSVHYSLPFITETIAGAACFVLITLIREQNKAGFKKPTASYRRHFNESIKYLFATPYLRVLALSGTLFSVMLGMCIQFVNEAAMIEYGFSADMRGFLIAGAGLFTLFILHGVLFNILKSDTTRILYLTAGASTAYLFMGIGSVPLFLFGYLLWSCLNATSSFIRVMIHDRIPGSHRSTIMSSFKLLAVLTGMTASVITGSIVQWAGTPRVAYVIFGCFACFVLLPCAFLLITSMKNTTQSLAPEKMTEND